MRIVMAGLVFLALGAPAPGQAKSIDKHFHETFAVEPGAILRLSHGDGDAEITPWDRDEVDVDIVYRADYTLIGVGREPDFEAELSQEGPVIHVTGRETGVAMVGIFLSTDVREYRYTIRAPAWLAVDSRGLDGDLRITGLRGEVRCRVDDGDVTLEDVEAERIVVTAADGDVHLAGVRGALRVDCEDGNVTGERIAAPAANVTLEDGDLRLLGCSGEWDIQLEDGDATLRDQASGRISIRGEDGDVSVHLLPGDPAEVEIQVEDGSVELIVDARVSTAFLLSSQDGRVKVEEPGTKNLEQDGRRLYGEIGDAAGQIRAHTADGRVSLRVSRGGA